MFAINNVPDHLHLLEGFGTTMSMADFMEEIKAISSKFINDKDLIGLKIPDSKNGLKLEPVTPLSIQTRGNVHRSSPDVHKHHALPYSTHRHTA